MLTLETGLTRELKIARLAKIRRNFATYFGFTSNDTIITAQNYASTVATQPPLSTLTTTSTGNTAALQQRFNIGRGDPMLRGITGIFLEGDGYALSAMSGDRSIANQLKQAIAPGTGTTRTPEQIENFNRFITMFYSPPNNFIPPANMDTLTTFQPTLDRIGFNTPVTTNPTTVDEQESKQALSAFMMKHPVLVPSEKNSDLLSVFFNAIPSLELTRATPVMNVRIFSKNQVFRSDESGKLSSVSLPKFLEGAININENSQNPRQYSVLRAISLANQVTSSSPLADGSVPDTTKDFQYYSVSGMELFQSPQTLVNPDAAKIRSNFLALPIDPFRPLATIKSFDVDVKSTGYGLISTKQSKLEIVLHDRSRMGEFADILKPDRAGAGGGFIEVEYGWSHPDGLSVEHEEIKNDFAELLNLTRSIDHYTVTNSSFSFDDVGQVNIILNLISRGVSEMSELSITGEQNELRQQLQHIRAIAEAITQLTSQVYRPRPEGASGDDNREEIRGHQMLGAAGDATNFLILSPELIASYRQLKAALEARSGSGNNRNNAAISLRNKIIELVGDDPNSNATTPRRGNTATERGGFVGQARRTVNSSIKAALELMNRGSSRSSATSRDAFFSVLDNRRTTEINGWASAGRQEGVRRSREQTAADEGELLNIDESHSSIPKVISLGTIIMSLVAKPLAGMKVNGVRKFKEVQVYFYAFNPKAGCMSQYNIAQFPIFTKYFAREYSRYRLQTAGRSATVSITDFMTFLHDKIIDDTMNPAYGINSLYKPGREGPEAKGNADTFDRELRRIMIGANIGASPDFQQPMLTYDIESCPSVDSPSQTILKIHVVDRTNSTRSPLRELLTLSINDTLSSVSTFPDSRNEAATIETNEQNHQNDRHNTSTAAAERADALRKNWRDCHSEIQQHALALDLIEDVSTVTINNSGEVVRRTLTPAPAPSYRFKGGSDKLKSMIMEYTPHVIYGAMHTAIKQASLSTQANATLSTINMVRAGNADAILATGEQPGGIPMQIYPVQLSLTSLGCPFIRYSQELFVDFGTNTTADNLYYVTSIQHRLTPGEFTTTMKLTPCDAFPAYRNFIGQLNDGANRLIALGPATPAATATAPVPAGSAASGGGGGAHGRGGDQGHNRRRLPNDSVVARPQPTAAEAGTRTAAAPTRTAAAPTITGLSTGDSIIAAAYVTYYNEYMRRNNNTRGGDFLTPEQFVNQRQQRRLYQSVRNIHSPLYDPDAED